MPAVWGVLDELVGRMSAPDLDPDAIEDLTERIGIYGGLTLPEAAAAEVFGWLSNVASLGGAIKGAQEAVISAHDDSLWLREEADHREACCTLRLHAARDTGSLRIVDADSGATVCAETWVIHADGAPCGTPSSSWRTGCEAHGERPWAPATMWRRHTSLTTGWHPVGLVRGP